jgi:dipeptidyl aminopeptidase/acylaminoacyl peptidase
VAAQCLVLHGTADEGIPFELAERFCKLMKDAGNSCQLVPLEGAGHGFSVYKKGGDNQQFGRAMREIEEFFRSIGYLKEEPKH